jgi:hypothetical protein
VSYHVKVKNLSIRIFLIPIMDCNACYTGRLHTQKCQCFLITIYFCLIPSMYVWGVDHICPLHHDHHWSIVLPLWLALYYLTLRMKCSALLTGASWKSLGSVKNWASRRNLKWTISSQLHRTCVLFHASCFPLQLFILCLKVFSVYRNFSLFSLSLCISRMSRYYWRFWI